MSVTTATPSEVDTRIVEICTEVERVKRDMTIAQRCLESDLRVPLRTEQARRDLDALSIRRKDLETELNVLDREYRRRRWTRYYLVQNTGGHVHTSTACDTCHVTTSFGWLTQYSGTDHDEMGRLAGMDACARCFPHLPPEVMRAKRDALVDTPQRLRERAQREADQSVEKARAAAKGITSPEGVPLHAVDVLTDGRLVRGDLIKTEVAASRRAMQDGFDLRWYGEDHPHAPAWRETVHRMLAALAHKRGTTVEAERAELAKKVEAKYRRESV